MKPDRSESAEGFRSRMASSTRPGTNRSIRAAVFDPAAVDQADLFTAPEAQHILNMRRL